MSTPRRDSADADEPAESPDAVYHVTARGNNRQRIFYDERDRRHFVELIGEVSQRQALEVQA